MTELEQSERMAVARFIAAKNWPALVPAFYALKMVYAPDMGRKTLGVDRYGRLYYNPPDDWTPNQLAGVLLHEVGHVLRKHWKRFPRGGRKANIAEDMEINDDLADMGVDLPDGAIYPHSRGLESGLLAEEYFLEIPDNIPDYHDCGSCTGGEARDYELPPDHAEVPSLSEPELNAIRHQVAENIRKAGIGSGGWDRWAHQILNPRIDPLRILRAFVTAVTTHGVDEDTYTRPNRRWITQSDIIFPGFAGRVVDVAFLIDTSGSMSDEDIGIALGTIRNGLKRRSRVTVYVGDTQITGQKRIARLEDVKAVMKGGGGTDMAGIIRHLDSQRKRPRALIVLTDGYTPWPKTPPSFPVAVLLTQGNKEDVPQWAKKIVLRDKR